MDIQIAILDQYHDRLQSSVEAFKVLSSSIARAVQGTSKEEVQSLSGVSGLERLCKVYGSAMFLENCMRDWNEDIVCLPRYSRNRRLIEGFKVFPGTMG